MFLEITLRCLPLAEIAEDHRQSAQSERDEGAERRVEGDVLLPHGAGDRAVQSLLPFVEIPVFLLGEARDQPGLAIPAPDELVRDAAQDRNELPHKIRVAGDRSPRRPGS